MKTIGITCTVILSALLGTAASALAAQEHPGEKQDHSQQQNSHEEAKPQQQHIQKQQRAQQPRQEQSRPQHHAQPSRQEQSRPQQQHAQQPVQRQQANRTQQRSPEQRGAEQRVWQEHRASNWQSDHRTWQQRGGYRGYRIPEHQFQGYFGRNHWFRIGGLPFMVEGGYPRFQYEGYWFSLLDPWPANWGDSWYDNDDVYVDYVDNGYYLFNRTYPGMGIAISISR
jgi:hypothetical protein